MDKLYEQTAVPDPATESSGDSMSVDTQVRLPSSEAGSEVSSRTNSRTNSTPDCTERRLHLGVNPTPAQVTFRVSGLSCTLTLCLV